ncbi:twin-arginine translocase subunit TatB [Frateuria sp. MAH-13]|uniref:Sec-independent protein translocase protein TatB n=1 Tax=Frateuria flava TaxID=2821489 RepID=A0ABS4DMR3_9GAMM|nr:Sec-independent protein translocase protein TatB [Frateuria flava]MBP1474317.1 twin-arginine translocase subunit TatB [Frateuria flava]
MIEISFGKMLLLALIALLVLGPEKLPGAARTAGALVRRVRNTWDSVRAEVERELEIEEIKRTAREAAARAEAAQAQMNATAREVREVVGSVAAAPAPAMSSGSGPEARLASDVADGTNEGDETAPERDTLTGDLFADDPKHAPVKEPPHGIA